LKNKYFNLKKNKNNIFMMSDQKLKIKIYEDLLLKSWKIYPKDSETPKEIEDLNTVVDSQNTQFDSQPTLIDSQQTIMETEYKKNIIPSPFGYFDFHDVLSINRRKIKLQKANKKLKKLYKKRNRKIFMEKNQQIYEEALKAVLNKKDDDDDDEKPILYAIGEEDDEEKEYDFNSNQNSHISKKSSLKSDIFSNFSSDMF